MPYKDPVAGRRAYYEAHGERVRAESKEWYENHREYRVEYLKKYRAENRERLVAQRLQYIERNREKIRELNGRRRAKLRNAPEIEKIDRAALYARDGGRCHICGKHVSRSSYALDHLVPLARGGAHVATNLRVAHKVCNSRRGAGRIAAQLLLL